MTVMTWDDQVKVINAQCRYERLIIISKDLYKLLFDYQNPDYSWTCNEYGEMFKQLNKLCREYDGQDWLTSELLDDHWKTRQVVIRASNEWRNIQLGKGLE